MNALRCTWLARDTRTANPNFVRFKTWGTVSDSKSGEGERATNCPRLASHSSFPPSHLIIATCTASLCTCPTPQLLSARAVEKNLTCLISIKNRKVNVAWYGMWRVGDRIAPTPSSRQPTLSTHPPHNPITKFEIRKQMYNTHYESRVRITYARPREKMVHPRRVQ